MNNSADLLKELRIDRSAPPPPTSRRGLWIALAAIVALIVLALVAWAVFGRARGVEVQTATVTAIGNGGDANSVAVVQSTFSVSTGIKDLGGL